MPVKIEPIRLVYIALVLGVFYLASHSMYHYLARFSAWQSKAKRWFAISPLLGSMAPLFLPCTTSRHISWARARSGFHLLGFMSCRWSMAEASAEPSARARSLH